MGEFLPILMSEVFRPVSPKQAKREGGSLGSKSDVLRRSWATKANPVLHVRFPAPWSVLAKNRKDQNWRGLLNLVKTAVLGDD